MSWTEERVERLKSLWAEGMSASRIATELGGVTRNAVIGKVHRLGLSNRAASKTAKAAEPEPAPAAAPAPAPAPESVSPPPAPEAPKTPPSPPEAAPAAPLQSATPAEPAEVETPPAARSVPPAAAQPLATLGEAAPDLRELEKQALRLSLLQLTERTCKWPIGDPNDADFHFCGLPSANGKPYCASHAQAAYQPMSSRRDRERARIANRAQSA